MQRSDHVEQTVTQISSGVNGKLQGFPADTWGAQAFLGKILRIPESGNVAIRGVVKFPVASDKPPAEVVILPKDFGKRGLKGGGVNQQSIFKSTIMPDAYSAICDIQQEDGTEEGGATVYTWRVKEHGQHGRTSELFLFGNAALRTAETLPVNDDVAIRLADERTKDMLHASVALDLQELGLTATIMDQNMETVKKHNVLIILGVPAGDLNKESTKKAAQGLKGLFTVEQKNARTGMTRTWLIEIIGVLVEAQPKGTLYTATRKLNGTSALSKQLITIFDIGGGDVYEYEVDLPGGFTAIPKRLGDGTIQIARALCELVEEHYGIQISEIEAQEALYRRKIWKGGEEVSIEHLIGQLKPRFVNLLTRVNISSRVLTTFIIFTGGGAALLSDEIRAKFAQKARALQEGVDYLIMPAEIASVANCIGLFAIGYYKIQQLIRKHVEAYVDLLSQRAQVQQQVNSIRSSSKWGQDRQRLAELQQQTRSLDEQIKTHVGQYYPEVQHQVQEQRVSIPNRS